MQQNKEERLSETVFILMHVQQTTFENIWQTGNLLLMKINKIILKEEPLQFKSLDPTHNYLSVLKALYK